MTAFEIIAKVFPADAEIFDGDLMQVDQYPNGVGLSTFGENIYGFVEIDACKYVDGRVIDNCIHHVHVDNLDGWLHEYIR